MVDLRSEDLQGGELDQLCVASITQLTIIVFDFGKRSIHRRRSMESIENNYSLAIIKDYYG